MVAFLVGFVVGLAVSSSLGFTVGFVVADELPVGTALAGTETAGRCSGTACPLPWLAIVPSVNEVSPMAPDTTQAVALLDMATVASSRPFQARRDGCGMTADAD